MSEMLKPVEQVKPFQDLVKDLSETMGIVVGIVDISSTVIACSDVSKIGTFSISLSFTDSYELFTCDGFTYKPFGDITKTPDYAVFVEGINVQSEKFANMLAIAFTNIKTYFDEKYDRNNFIKNVILENVLSGDLLIKIRDLKLNNEVSRVVFLIRVISTSEANAFDVVRNLFPDKTKDFLFAHTESDIVLVKEIKNNNTSADFELLAETILSTLSSELYVNANIGIGTPVDNIKDLSISFKEAVQALEVGKVFDNEKPIVNYVNLGIARLIYHLPETLCKTFLNEVFKRGSVESLDQETLFTIHKFFENNLNVSETSRKLFVHRNTLVYRLEKIKKLTGLDLREFDHAIVFKIALMVKKFLISKKGA
ncbi:MAG: helix-turn-helix domain-containing protein [Oscillospiraceae bacterium]|jgi:carbohydrate diacid regulator|nr:helix-turn-helix domain-containing protein [Oscillospiraceae bacterium]